MDANKPSRVLHIRGVPVDAVESEVIQLGLPFGHMTNLVMARKKNQVCSFFVLLLITLIASHTGKYANHVLCGRGTVVSIVCC